MLLPLADTTAMPVITW